MGPDLVQGGRHLGQPHPAAARRLRPDRAPAAAARPTPRAAGSPAAAGAPGSRAEAGAAAATGPSQVHAQPSADLAAGAARNGGGAGKAAAQAEADAAAAAGAHATGSGAQSKAAGDAAAPDGLQAAEQPNMQTPDSAGGGCACRRHHCRGRAERRRASRVR